jgi:BirA family transcriptional regulator, biotin operon repressor / biotin---[acetyl-CoA-carboxylase] ligase
MTPWPQGVECHRLEEVDSTNAEAQRRALAGATGPLWIIARRQVQGRGRRGRNWSDHPGNFTATHLFVPGGTPKEAALRSFTAALALQDALVDVTGRPELFSLKWPNDVLLSGGKLAGILLEMCAGPQGQPPRLAVGIGVNLAGAPEREMLEPGALRPVSLAQSTGLAVAPNDFFEVIVPAFARWEGILTTQGFEPVRRAWLARAVRLGEEILARLPGREIRGVFRSIDATGAILLETAAGPLSLPAADIYFGPTASAALGTSHAPGH